MLKRGDKVCYGNGVYYYQSNGNTAYLYCKQKHIGFYDKIIFRPMTSSLKKAPLDAIVTTIDIDQMRNRPPTRAERDAHEDTVRYLSKRIDDMCHSSDDSDNS